MPPHDQLFKTLLRAFFLRLAAPGVAAKASLARIVFLDKELLAGTGRREADLLAWALAALMDSGPASRAEHRLACLRRIGAARLRVERKALLADFVDAYLPLRLDEEKRYKIAGESKQEARAMWMTWSERLHAEGYREGRKEGTKETLRRVLLRQLRRRFGPVPEAVKHQIEEISSIPRLNGLLERVLTASSLKDLGLPH